MFVKPSRIPDKLRGYLTIALFTMWLAFLFSKRRKRISGRIVNGVLKRLPQKRAYRGYFATEVMMVVLIALSVADSVLPWMTGRATAAAGVMEAAGALISGAISLITWQYVKEASFVAAQALTEGK